MIRGWDEGLCKLKLHQKATLTCPPEYAYGEKGIEGVIPPNETLIFDVEVVDFTMEIKEGWGSVLFRFGLYLLSAIVMFEKLLAPATQFQPSKLELT